MTKEYHKILNVSYNASLEDIKAAYKKLAKQWHPDKWRSASESDRLHAEEMMKNINEAYAVLKSSPHIPINKSYSWKSEKATTTKSPYAKEDDIWDIDLNTLSRDYFDIKPENKIERNKPKESLWSNSDEISKDFFGI